MWKDWLALYLSLLASFTQSYSSQDGCSLPDDWTGAWFESGVPGTVSLNASSGSVQHKGKCVKKLRYSSSHFIFQSSREGNCKRCLSIYQKHDNVLQYKESKCMMEHMRNYNELCRSISVDEPLKTLFRVTVGGGVACPITGTYSFTYSRGHGLCSYPLSSLHQCADKSQMVLSYQACVDIKGSQRQTEQAHCIGDWKEGSTYYFAAILNTSHVTRQDREDSYRCFVYKQIHNGYLLSQSAEAKCNLYTATEGYRTMTLTRLREEDTSCELPAWVTQHRRYHSLHHNTLYNINQAGNTITVQPEDVDAVEGLKNTRLECVSSKLVTNLTAKYIVQSVESCSQATFHCVQLWRRTDNVIQIKIGKHSPSSEDACHEQLFFDSSVATHTLTTAHLHSATCPLTGSFFLSPDTADCQAQPTLAAGCDNNNNIVVKQPCEGTTTEFSCHDSWQEERGDSKTRYTIVSYKSNISTSAKGCLIKGFNQNEEDLTISLHQDCNDLNHPVWSYSALNFGDCAPTALATANSAALVTPHIALVLSVKILSTLA